MTDNHKAFYLSVALACIADVKAGERKTDKRGMVRSKKLAKLEGDLVKVTDLYLPKSGFDYEDMKKAEIIIDLVNEKVKELYP